MPPRIPEPRATQHENVYVTIVVVIALNHVQTAGKPEKTSLFGSLVKPP